MSFLPQDSSSVIQFMARAKVKVEPALRVVEIANGNPEETLVSLLPWDSSLQRMGTWSWDLKGETFSKLRGRVCGRLKAMAALGSRGPWQASWLCCCVNIGFRILLVFESFLQ